MWLWLAENSLPFLYLNKLSKKLCLIFYITRVSKFCFPVLRGYIYYHILFNCTLLILVPVFKGRPRKKKNQPNVNLSDEKMDLFMQQEKEEGSSNDRNWTVPVTRIAVSADTSTIQLKRVSHKKNGSVTSELQLKSLVPLDYSKVSFTIFSLS